MNTVRIEDLKSHLEQPVTLQGWVSAKRSSGKIHFIQMRDGSGVCQCIVEPHSEEAFNRAKELRQESSLIIQGIARADERSPGGVEMAVTHLEIVHEGEDEYPISRKAHGVDFLMSHRHLWLRSERQTAILKIRHSIIKAARDFFDQNGFTLIDTPLFQPGAAEGASTLFALDYFDEEVYLAQTGQLYLESAAMALGKVYCFGPTFRAEKSKTRRHLTEFWMIEPEIAYAELPDLECLSEAFLCYIVEYVLEKHPDELALLERDLEPLKKINGPFPRITYSDAVELLRSDEVHQDLLQKLEEDKTTLAQWKSELENKTGQLGNSMKAWKKEKLEEEVRTLSQAIKDLEVDVINQPAHIESARNFEWGHDFGGDDETILSKRYDRPLIVTHYPKEVKAFYMKENADNPKVVNNLDVLAPEGYGEIIGGSQREDNLELMIKKMEHEGMDLAPYQWYLDLRRYGSVPHGGFGLGIERTVSWICGLKHIRETIPFPRLMGRVYP